MKLNELDGYGWELIVTGALDLMEKDYEYNSDEYNNFMLNYDNSMETDDKFVFHIEKVEPEFRHYYDQSLANFNKRYNKNVVF